MAGLRSGAAAGIPACRAGKLLLDFVLLADECGAPGRVPLDWRPGLAGCSPCRRVDRGRVRNCASALARSPRRSPGRRPPADLLVAVPDHGDDAVCNDGPSCPEHDLAVAVLTRYANIARAGRRRGFRGLRSPSS